MNEETKQTLINIHNAVVSLHPTGEDIITVAAVLMDLRKIINTEQEGEESNG